MLTTVRPAGPSGADKLSPLAPPELPTRPGERAAALPAPSNARSPTPTAAPALGWRKLLPYEFGLYEAHLLRLDGGDRSARFDAGLSDGAIRAYCRRLAWPQTRILGCFVEGVLRGAAELQTLAGPEATLDAELALSVERAFQGRRIGEGLVRRTLLIARNRWLRRVGMLSSPSNRRLHRIARRLGGETTVDEAGVETLFQLVRPDAASILQEWTEDGTAAFLWSLDRWSRAVAIARPS